MKEYYGIESPDGYIWWMDTEKYKCWTLFFQYKPHRLPLEEAQRAYESIGYKCVELKVEKVDISA